MNVYAEVGASLMQVGGECPEGWIVMLEPRPESELSTDYTAQSDGTWAISQETLNAKAVVKENAWRVSEIATVKDNLDAILFEDPGALPGTSDEWKAYGVALRKWKDGNPDFPDSTKRPKRPEAGE